MHFSQLHTAAASALRQIHSAASQGQTKNAQDGAVREREKKNWKQKQVFIAPTLKANAVILKCKHDGKSTSLNLKSGIRCCPSDASGPQTSRRLASDSPSKYEGGSTSAPFQIIGPSVFPSSAFVYITAQTELAQILHPEWRKKNKLTTGRNVFMNKSDRRCGCGGCGVTE